MIIIVDVNIFLSALIKDSTTREILIKSGHIFYFPEISLQKIEKYKTLITEKSGLSETEIFSLFNSLLNYIKIVPNNEIQSNWREAKMIIGDIDEEDIAFIACALTIEDSIIWSDDKHFEKHAQILTLKTTDIVEMLKED